MGKSSIWAFFVVCLILVTTPVFGQPGKMSRGQTVYAPAAHNCFKVDPVSGDCTLSSTTGLIIRNLDFNFPITLTSIELYSPTGDFEYDLLEDGPQSINPLATMTFNINREFWMGVPGRPSFIVKWSADRRVNAPIIESARALVNGVFPYDFTWGGQDITPATVIRERSESEYGNWRQGQK